MFNLFYILAILWLIRTFKNVLFWVYLWQLKEYHIGRLKDHFSTSKGRGLILSYGLAFKIFLIIVFVFSSGFDSFLFGLLFLIYLAESAIFVRQVLRKNFKKPVFTFKAILLTTLGGLIPVLFVIWAQNKNLAWLLGFDIILPIIISAVVLFFQPFFVIKRNMVLSYAKEKIKEFPNVKVIAITGSYGKTSTKEFLTTILSKKFNVLSTSKHQNSEIGVANSILNNLNKEHEIFIAEVGAYNKGKVKEVCNIIKPKIGIVTGVNEQHMALFGSLDNLLSGEGGREMAEILAKDGLLVVNGDNKYCMDLIKRFHGEERIYTESNKNLNADIWTESVSVSKDHLSFIAKNKKGEMANFYVNVLGRQNVQNLLGAILVASELGMSFHEISQALKEIKEEQAGMTLTLNKHGINIIDSSYSSNPDGVMAELDYLSVFENKKFIVMPCLIELGEKAGHTHEQIGKKIGQVCNMAVVTSRDYFAEIKKGAEESGMKPTNILFCEKPEDIYSIITLFAKAGDAVLLEGRVPAGLIKLLK